MRKYLIAGILFWVPVWVTYVVIRFIVELLDRSLALIPQKYQPSHLIGFDIPGIGLIFTIIIVFVTGLLVTNFIGHRLVDAWERLLSRIPLIRSIYHAVKQVLTAVFQPKSQSFRKVIMIEFPRKGSWAVGFQTSETLENLPHNKSSVTCFIPTSPNPTSGFLVFVPKEEVTELDMSIEEAFKLIISIGVVIPSRDLAKIKPDKDKGVKS